MGIMYSRKAPVSFAHDCFVFVFHFGVNKRKAQAQEHGPPPVAKKKKLKTSGRQAHEIERTHNKTERPFKINFFLLAVPFDRNFCSHLELGFPAVTM